MKLIWSPNHNYENDIYFVHFSINIADSGVKSAVIIYKVSEFTEALSLSWN